MRARSRSPGSSSSRRTSRPSPVAQAYWQDAAADEAMQDDHAFAWRALVDTVDVDLTGARVLDAGCNRRGFLLLLAHRCAIVEVFGYDPAAGAIADARR